MPDQFLGKFWAPAKSYAAVILAIGLDHCGKIIATHNCSVFAGPRYLDIERSSRDLAKGACWHELSPNAENFHDGLRSAIAVAIAVTVAIAVGVAIEAAAIAVVVVAMVLAAANLICCEVIGCVNESDRYGLVADGRAARKIKAAGVSGSKSQTPRPPISIWRGPLGIAKTIAVGNVSRAIVDAVIVILIGSVEFADV